MIKKPEPAQTRSSAWYASGSYRPLPAGVHWGSCGRVTWVNTQGFYTKTLNPPDPKLNAANEGRGAILWWGAARTWEFEDGVCKSYTRSEHTAETLIMAFRVLEKEAA